MIDEDDVVLKEKPEERKARRHKIHQKDYIKIVRAKDLIPNFAIIWTADSGKCRCVTLESI